MSPDNKGAKALKVAVKPQLSHGDVIRRALLSDPRLKGSSQNPVAAGTAREFLRNLATVRNSIATQGMPAQCTRLLASTRTPNGRKCIAKNVGPPARRPARPPVRMWRKTEALFHFLQSLFDRLARNGARQFA